MADRSEFEFWNGPKDITQKSLTILIPRPARHHRWVTAVRLGTEKSASFASCPQAFDASSHWLIGAPNCQRSNAKIAVFTTI
jgi:hypothetical protein